MILSGTNKNLYKMIYLEHTHEMFGIAKVTSFGVETTTS
jgi:hypothetical protein